MKLSKELRQIINKLRSHSGKKNGVIRYLREYRFMLKEFTDKRFKEK